MTASAAPTETLTISEILADLPEGVEWKIVNPLCATLNTPDVLGIVFWDESDPENVGWAYRITVYSREADYDGERHPVREESGCIDSPRDLSAWF
jgi:hypothetical protein